MARKNGILTQINDLWLKGAPKEAKREAGIRVNDLKARITELVEAAHVSASGRGLAGVRERGYHFAWGATADRRRASGGEDYATRSSASSRNSGTRSLKVRSSRPTITTSKR